MRELFDIIILVGNNDIENVEKYVEYNKKNVIGYRNIYIISPLDINIDDCILIKDDIFPFKLYDISHIISNKSRSNWYLQQLIKLYAMFVIPDILSKILTIDADTYFLKPTSFLEDDKILLNYGVEFHKPYFEHMERLHPSLIKFDSKKSGIVHHALLDKNILSDLFKMVEDYHDNKQFWIVFLECIEKNDSLVSGASEFEIYFNYCNLFHNDKIKIRYLNFNDIFDNKKEYNEDYDYFSKHKWFYDNVSI